MQQDAHFIITLASSRTLSGETIFLPCGKLLVLVLCRQISSPLNSSASISICSPPCFRQKVIGPCQDFHIRHMENLFQNLKVESGSTGHLTLSVILSHRRHGGEGWVEGELCLKQLQTGSVCSLKQHRHTQELKHTCSWEWAFVFFQTHSYSAIWGSRLKKEIETNILGPL